MHKKKCLIWISELLVFSIHLSLNTGTQGIVLGNINIRLERSSNIDNAVVEEFLLATKKWESSYVDGSVFSLEWPNGGKESSVIYIFPNQQGIAREEQLERDDVVTEYVTVETPVKSFAVNKKPGSDQWNLLRLEQPDFENQFSSHFQEVDWIKAPWCLGGVTFTSILDRDYVKVKEATLDSVKSIGTVVIECRRNQGADETLAQKIPFLVDLQTVTIRFDVKNSHRLIEVIRSGTQDGMEYRAVQTISYESNEKYQVKETYNGVDQSEVTVKKLPNIDFSGNTYKLDPEYYGIRDALPDSKATPLLNWQIFLLFGAACLILGCYFLYFKRRTKD